MGAGGELVGRAAQVALIEDLCDQVASGACRPVLFAGEAGIGKSRLLAVADEHARSRGWLVVSGAAYELERDRPFTAIAEGVQRIAGTEPAAAGVLDLLRADADDDPVGRRTRIVDAFIDLVESVTDERPVAVLIDDLQWADASTILVAEQLLRRSFDRPILLVGAQRPRPRGPHLDAFAERVRSAGGAIVELPPLEAQDAAALASKVLPDAKPELVAAAGGNPFFIEELAAALDAEGATTEVGVPDSVQLTVLRRLGVLVPAETIDLLRLASILGRTFTVKDLATVSGQAAVDVHGVMSPAMDHRIIVESDDRLAFRHDIVREAVYLDMPASTRTALHRQAATAFERSGADVLTIAIHMELGATVPDPEAAEWVLEAARAANDITTMTDLLARSTDLEGRRSERRNRFTPNLVGLLGADGRLEEAIEVARRTFADRWESGEAVPTRIALTEAYASAGRHLDAVEALEALVARDDLNDEDMAWARRRLAQQLTTVGRLDEADAIIDEELGRDLDPEPRWWFLRMRAMTLARRGCVPEALTVVREADALATSTPLKEVWSTKTMEAELTFVLDRIDESEAAVKEHAARSIARYGTESVGLLDAAHKHHDRALRALACGDLGAAEVEAETAESYLADAGSDVLDASIAAIRAMILIHRGDLTGARTLLDAAAPALRRDPGCSGHQLATRARALVLEGDGDDQGAATVLADWLDLVEARGSIMDASEVVVDAARIGRVAGRDALTSRASSLAGQLADAMDSPTGRARALRCVGLGEADADELVRATEAYQGSLRRLEAAQADEDAGLALAEGGRSDDAAAYLARAAAAYERSGAARDTMRLDAGMRRVGMRKGRRGRRARPATGWAALTDTEREVVKLAAEGLSNPLIGERLFISRRTVETHLSHVFTKLGLTSRMQLAAERAKHERD